MWRCSYPLSPFRLKQTKPHDDAEATESDRQEAAINTSDYCYKYEVRTVLIVEPIVVHLRPYQGEIVSLAQFYLLPYPLEECLLLSHPRAQSTDSTPELIGYAQVEEYYIGIYFIMSTEQKPTNSVR